MCAKALQSYTLDCFNPKGDRVAEIEICTLSNRKNKLSTKSSEIPNLLEIYESFEAKKLGEAPVQLRESGSYLCKIKDLRPGNAVRKQLRLSRNKLFKAYGTDEEDHVLLQTRSSAGTLCLKLEEEDETGNTKHVGRGYVEIRSIKLDYRSEFRGMIKGIAEDARDFLLQLGGSTEMTMQSAWSEDPPTLVHQIEFLRNMMFNGGLWKPLDRILKMPHERLHPEPERRPISMAGRIDSSVVRQLASGQPRTNLPPGHNLYQKLNHTIPKHVTVRSKLRTTDTPENRFIKHALKDFARFLQHALETLELHQTKAKSDQYEVIIGDCRGMLRELNQRLHKGLFSQLDPPRTLPLGSPVLQRKSGYREVFQYWLAFKMSAKLRWEGAEDVFGGGKSEYSAGMRDLPSLYEAWLFFKLLRLFTSKFGLNFKDTKNFFTGKDGALGRFTLKQGKGESIGSSSSCGLKVQALFRYNHSFKPQSKRWDLESSWTRVLRPDYTISIWPSGMTIDEAERRDTLVHIHFDAKYRVDKISELFGEIDESSDETQEEQQNEEKKEERDGNYNRADLLKMHAYRDAIRRSEGAFVLYPGDTGKEESYRRWKGFHELLPGLGAFAVRPDENGDAKGIDRVEAFLDEAIRLLTNRASRLAHKRYHQRDEDTLNRDQIKLEEENKVSLANQIIEETLGPEAALTTPAQEVLVLSGVVKSRSHLKWILKNGLYNFRLDPGSGYLPNMAPSYGLAKVIALRWANGNPIRGLWRIVGRIEKRDSAFLNQRRYPDPRHQNYAIFHVEKVKCASRLNYNNTQFNELRESALVGAGAEPASAADVNSPFEASLKELLSAASN